MPQRPYLQLVALLLVACMALALLAPAPVSAARKKILHFAAKEPESLDPHSSTQGPVQAMAVSTRTAARRGRYRRWRVSSIGA